MQGIVAAEVMRRHRAEGQPAKKLQSAQQLLEEMMEGDEVTLAEKLHKLDLIYNEAASNKLFNLHSDMPEEEREGKILDGMIQKVEDRVDQVSSYVKLFGISTFFMACVFLLFLQRDIADAHDVENSVLNAVVSKLPETGSGGYFNSGIGAVGVLSSTSEFYDFLWGALLQIVFSDSTCGDGVCDKATEFQGIGRFGCTQDCGRYMQTNTLAINLAQFSVSNPDGWDISGIPQDPNPHFKWNLWSRTLGDYVFEQDQSNLSASVEVPDGNYTLRLYQTVKVTDTIDKATIAEYLKMKSSTIPDRTATSDYEYGDKREFLAASTAIIRQLQIHCESQNTYEPVDPGCERFDATEYAIRSMGAYGFEGKVRLADGSRNGKTLVTVSACSVFPNGSAGVDDPSNKQILKNAEPETECDSNDLRRRKAISHAQLHPWLADVPESAYSRMSVFGGHSSMRKSQAAQVHSHRSLLQIKGETSVDVVVSEQASNTENANTENSNTEDSANTEANTKLPVTVVSPDPVTVEDSNTEANTKLPVTVVSPDPVTVEDSNQDSGGDETPTKDLNTIKDEDNKVKEVALPKIELEVADSSPAQTEGYPGFTWAFVKIMPTNFKLKDPTVDIRYQKNFEFGALQCGENGVLHDKELIFMYAEEQNEEIILEVMVCNATTQIAKSQIDLGQFVFPPTIDLQLSFPASVFNSSSDWQDSDSLLLERALAQTLDIDQQRTQVWSVQTTSSRRLLAGGVTVEARALHSSNMEAQQKRKLLIGEPGGLRDTYIQKGGSSEVQLGMVKVTSRSPKGWAGAACTSHYDCEWGLFCAKWESDAAPGSSTTCANCELCVRDKVDSSDELCPSDTCPNSGGFPSCVSGEKLVKDLNCRGEYEFAVWAYHDEGANVRVKPDMFVTPKTITPFNRIVGAIVVTQERKVQNYCRSSSHSAVQKFTKAGKVMCPGDNLDPSPYGFDPAFMSFSKIYNGKLQPEGYYAEFERNNRTVAVLAEDGKNLTEQNQRYIPYGFFPHGYDSRFNATVNYSMDTGDAKNFRLKAKSDDHVIDSERERFKLYFDHRLTQQQASRMVTALKDGNFIDTQTDLIKIEMVTYNADVNLFALFTFTFDWQSNGNVKWDYEISSISPDVLKGPRAWLQIILCIVVVSFLVINCMLEVWDILMSLKSFAVMAYVRNPFNWLDWIHFFVLWTAVIQFSVFLVKANAFDMDDDYLILNDPVANARMFSTNPEAEKKFLDFMRDIRALSAALQDYFLSAGIAIILFIFRMLKSLDFQPRMGLVTRTIGAALTDLLHFFMLFGIVFFGYACVGTLLFGHLFTGMRTLTESCLTLFLFLLSLDTTQFFAQMDHAADPLAFHLFLWSYILLAFFVLLNIFLAVLVDAYAHIKQESSNSSKGMPGEIADVLVNSLKSFLPRSRYISDQQLLKALRRVRSSQTAPSAVHTAIHRNLSHRQAVLLPGGVEVTEVDMVKYAKYAAARRPSAISPEAEGSIGDIGMDVVKDLMSRYAENVQQREDQRTEDLLELVQVENAKRQMAMFKAQTNMYNEQSKVSALMELVAKGVAAEDEVRKVKESFENKQEAGVVGYLNVRVVSGSDLPKMDLVRNCDPFCVLFLDRGGDGTMYTTEVKRKNRNPTWNEDFTWELSRHPTTLNIAVMDKDNITRDDLVGVVNIPIDDLTEGETMDYEHEIVNPKIEYKLKGAALRVMVTRTKEPFSPSKIHGQEQAQERKDDSSRASSRDTTATSARRNAWNNDQNESGQPARKGSAAVRYEPELNDGDEGRELFMNELEQEHHDDGDLSSHGEPPDHDEDEDVEQMVERVSQEIKRSNTFKQPPPPTTGKQARPVPQVPARKR